ncbi:2-keto-4-pentenoate hydratase [Convivina intestini]|uniref:2-oxo-hept-3-ene-1,7-dioate hydratase n=1 Tax=Convivina intestini TaxID=1505726 RepID=A0A2U1DEX2_9LACO|nr:2-keto-4-pentenoate hydratase [Convivina intestini]PVY86233.1 2-oxo-hept-3-ene-1,7-dioate hydratase [Convivina intestini]CAH1851293.1 2-keto-4-pentenoate hydratase [Convivina intestini]CAH1851903.1 2-keto-4-pentenoate hydratase [Convivina intestini]SDB81715.1 2-oxo-hept-3-ene-1,7-dioate hydratase [Leuconostocaceae bacterium R-53105]
MTQTQLTANEEKLAQALYQAYTSQVALDMAEWEDLVQDDAAAYRVQARLMDLKGQQVGGYKVSLTSQQTQDMFDSKEPLFGAQVAQHFVPSPAKLSLKHDLMDPLAEVELVFKAKEPLLPTDTLADLARKTTVAPGVEVPDARFSDWFPSLSKYLVMADAAVGGYVVYGTERETNDFSMSDLTEVTTTLSHDGQEVAQGSSAEVLGNPLNSLQWLVKKLAEQGKELSAGQRVSSGTFLLPPHLTAGEWQASFNHGFSDVTLTVE